MLAHSARCASPFGGPCGHSDGPAGRRSHPLSLVVAACAPPPPRRSPGPTLPIRKARVPPVGLSFCRFRPLREPAPPGRAVRLAGPVTHGAAAPAAKP